MYISVAELLPSVRVALGSIPSITKFLQKDRAGDVAQLVENLPGMRRAWV